MTNDGGEKSQRDPLHNEGEAGRIKWCLAPARASVRTLQRPQSTRQTSHEKVRLLVLAAFSRTGEVEPSGMQVNTILEALALLTVDQSRHSTRDAGLWDQWLYPLQQAGVGAVCPKHGALWMPSERTQCRDGSC